MHILPRHRHQFHPTTLDISQRRHNNTRKPVPWPLSATITTPEPAHFSFRSRTPCHCPSHCPAHHLCPCRRQWCANCHHELELASGCSWHQRILTRASSHSSSHYAYQKPQPSKYRDTGAISACFSSFERSLGGKYKRNKFHTC